MEEYVAERKTHVDPGVESQGVPYMQESEARIVGQAGGTKEILFFHNDHLGTPIVVTDIEGMVVSKHRYSPFGEELAPEGSNSHTHRFTGHERDNETGLDYMFARYYASSQARFLSVDPLDSSAAPASPQTWNRYAYTINNPVRFIDPRGLTIKVAGTDQQDYVDNLAKSTGFKLKQGKNGNVKFDGKAPSKKGLSPAQLGIRKAIKGGADVQIKTVKGDAGVDFGTSTGAGHQTLDMGDIGLLNNPTNSSAATSENVTLHETLEAFGTAQGMALSAAHANATSLSIGFSTPTSVVPTISGGMLTGGVLTQSIHGDPAHVLNVTTQLVTPINVSGPLPSGRQPQHIVDVSSTP
jgi:RHS repeat-associated protein